MWGRNSAIDFCQQVMTSLRAMNCLGCPATDDTDTRKSSYQELRPVVEYRLLKFKDLSDDAKMKIWSFLEIKDLIAFAQTNRHQYQLFRQHLGSYLRDHLGIFHRSREFSQNQLALRTVFNFYRGQDLGLKDEHQAQAWYEQAFLELTELVYAKKWPHLYLAVMYFYGLGVKKDLLRAQEHIDQVKIIWLEVTQSLEPKNEKLRNMFSGILSTSHHPDEKVNEENRNFYKVYLNPVYEENYKEKRQGYLKRGN